MSCSWSSNVTSRQVTPSYHIISHGIIILYHIISSYHITWRYRTQQNKTLHHIISNVETRWCWCCSYRYSATDIIDLSARHTSRHHITSHHITSHHITSNAIVTLKNSHSHSHSHSTVGEYNNSLCHCYCYCYCYHFYCSHYCRAVFIQCLM